MKAHIVIVLAGLLMFPLTHNETEPIVKGLRIDQIRAIKTAGSLNSEISWSRIVFIFREAFDIPLNTESHPVYARTINTWKNVTFQIKRGETLLDAFNKYTKEMDNLLTFTVINDQFCILPVRNCQEEILTNLDVKISLHLKEATAWEAIKSIVIEVNESNNAPYPFYAMPSEWMGTRGRKATIPKLTGLREITLDLENISAREALCSVFEASSITLSYGYTFSMEQDGLIIFSEDEDRIEKQGSKASTPEEDTWWKNEMDEITASRPQKKN
jgi:hypothetical protein